MLSRMSTSPRAASSYQHKKDASSGSLRLVRARAQKWSLSDFGGWVRVIADVIILNGVLAFAFLLRYLWAVIYGQDELVGIHPNELAKEYIDQFFGVFWIVNIIGLATFWLSGLYTYSRTYRLQYKAIVVAQAVTFAFVLTGMVAFIMDEALSLPRSVLLMAWAMTTFMFVVSRLWSAIWRHVLQHDARRPDDTRRTHAASREKTVLVIGGAGYIGSALLPKLLDEGYRVRILDLFLYGTGPIAAILDHPKLEPIRADFRQVDALVRAMQGVDHLVHLGGIVGDPACAIDEELTVDVNLAATRTIAEVAKGQGIKHFIFASTCSVYGASDSMLTEESELNPLSLYARSKIASEQVLLSMADNTFTPTIVRFGTVYGLSGRTRFDLVVNLLAAKAVFDGQITVFGGDQWRPFLHVDDAALAVSELLRLPPGRGAEVFNVGSDKENYTIAQVGEIVKTVVPQAELLLQGSDQDRRNYQVSFRKIRMMVGFAPRWTVEDGVRQVVDAIQAGKVVDYREVLYSNEKYLNEANGGALARPHIQWAQDLIREPLVSATARKRTA